MKNFFICFIAFVFVLSAGCGETAEKPANDENQTEDSEQSGLNDADDTAIDEESGDQDVVEEENLAQNIKASGCGGFEEENAVIKNIKLAEDEIIDCSQQLIWNYDDSTDVIEIVIKNAELNCAGVGKVQITKTETGYDYILFEDLSVSLAGCSCLFDFSAELNGISAESLNLEVKHRVKHTEIETDPYWSGTLDLTQKNGTVVVKERTGDICSEFQN